MGVKKNNSLSYKKWIACFMWIFMMVCTNLQTFAAESNGQHAAESASLSGSTFAAGQMIVFAILCVVLWFIFLFIIHIIRQRRSNLSQKRGRV